MFNRSTVKTGRLASPFNLKALPFSRYTAKLPAAPAELNRDPVHDWGMLLNDQIGDCTCAGVLHMVQLVSAINGREFKPTDREAELLYEKFGYVPGDTSTDIGADENQVLRYWLHNPVDGHKLYATATIPATDLPAIRQAIWLFGTVYFGVNLPALAENQTAWDSSGYDPGDPNAAPGSWGGHAICSSGRYTKDNLPVITWGAEMAVSNRFVSTYFDEVHVPLIGDWIAGNGKCPDGFALPLLQADLQAMGRL